MLSKHYRLQIQNWFKERKKTISRKSDFFIIKVARNNLSFSRFGAIISQKVHKSAVKRNKIKRAIFNFIRLNKYHESPGKDVLIIVLPAISRLTSKEIKEELKKIYD